MSAPAMTKKLWPVSMAVWNTDGNISFSFQKSYKDKQSGEYKSTNFFYPDDMAKLQILVQWANNQIVQKGMTEKKQNQGETVQEAHLGFAGSGNGILHNGPSDMDIGITDDNQSNKITDDIPF